MIDVHQLTKKFPGRTAVDGVSFQVGSGEVVGLLGPNGAGKTTTMRMLTGYLPPTAGSVMVAGCNMVEDSLAARRRIGYLPEHCPLHTDMRVDEYLKFRARLKGLSGKACRQAVAEAKELCHLSDIGRRIIGQLSKGYRQRVGLADALVHRPDLLILDEPTLGLDPNQVRHARSLIQQLAERHTILISSHILSEIEHTCGRVLIFKEGRIIASDSPRGLRERMRAGGEVLAEVQAPAERVDEVVRALNGLEAVQVETLADGWVRLRLQAAAHVDLREPLFRLACQQNWSLRELQQQERSLEDAFVELTRGAQGDF